MHTPLRFLQRSRDHCKLPGSYGGRSAVLVANQLNDRPTASGARDFNKPRLGATPRLEVPADDVLLHIVHRVDVFLEDGADDFYCGLF
jgi:hypothetical protein